MKWFRSSTKYECEVTPKARVLWLKVLTDDDAPRARILAFYTPFKRWRKFIHPWHLGHSEGWCTYNCAIRYNYTSHKFSFMSFWEPVNV